MPTYTIKDPQTGQSVTLKGDSPPSETELTEIFAKLPKQAAQTAGNIDLYKQPKVKNPDGSTSTVDSSSYNIDGQEVLLPSVTPDGRHLSKPDDIVAEYRKTGRHLGKFTTPAEATAYASKLHDDYAAGKYDKSPVPPGQPSAAPPGRTWTDTAVDLLPAAGGIVGGIVGGIGGTVAGLGVGGVPGGIGGAALGGSAGEAAKQSINRLRGAQAPATAGEAAADIGIQGAIQGAGQAVGGALAKGASKVATYSMNRALNLTDRLSREFPNLSQTMIDKALTVTQGGLGKARSMLHAAKGEANAALATAHAKGATVPIDAATKGLQTTLAKVLQSEDVEGGLATLAAVERKIAAGRAAALTPMEADALKASLQTQSKALYLAGKMGQGRPNSTIKAEALKDMAASLNQGIGDVTTAAGAPGYRAANAEAAELIGAVRGITKGIRPGANLYQAMVRPGVGAVLGGIGGAQQGGTKGAALGAVVGGALTSPAGMSRAAVALSKPGVQQILKGSPKLAAALASYLAAEEDSGGP